MLLLVDYYKYSTLQLMIDKIVDVNSHLSLSHCLLALPLSYNCLKDPRYRDDMKV